MVVLVEHEAFSTAFRELYTYGMELIDTASDYFSHEGRQAARLLGYEAAILYDSEVKRLGSRLMQVASWLLLERAMREQDMTAEVLAREKQKVILDMRPIIHNHPAWCELPERFRKLSEESLRFIERARYMDRRACRVAKTGDSNPVNEQLLKLGNAFDIRQES